MRFIKALYICTSVTRAQAHTAWRELALPFALASSLFIHNASFFDDTGRTGRTRRTGWGGELIPSELYHPRVI